MTQDIRKLIEDTRIEAMRYVLKSLTGKAEWRDGPIPTAWVESKIKNMIQEHQQGIGGMQVAAIERRASGQDSADIKDAEPYPELPMLGGTYLTQTHSTVKMVGIANVGMLYETLIDEAGVHRYSRRLSCAGRVTGTSHGWSHPDNLARPIRALKLERASPTDTDILNYLETMVVNVRTPLVHGSRDLFWASPEDLDGDEGPSDLRARAVKAMKERK